jgi:hypothetical protein
MPTYFHIVVSHRNVELAVSYMRRLGFAWPYRPIFGLVRHGTMSFTDTEGCHAFSSCFPQAVGALRRPRDHVLLLRREEVYGLVHTWALAPLNCGPRASCSPLTPLYFFKRQRTSRKLQLKALWYRIPARPCLQSSTATFASATYPAGGGTPML